MEIKISVLGDTTVGKTSLLNLVLFNKYEKELSRTTNPETYSYKLKGIKFNKIYKIKFWV